MKKVMIAVMVAVVLGQGLLSPAAGFVLKRPAATDLIPAVEEVLQGRTYISPSVNDKA